MTWDEASSYAGLEASVSIPINWPSDKQSEIPTDYFEQNAGGSPPFNSSNTPIRNDSDPHHDEPFYAVNKNRTGARFEIDYYWMKGDYEVYQSFYTNYKDGNWIDPNLYLDNYNGPDPWITDQKNVAMFDNTWSTITYWDDTYRTTGGKPIPGVFWIGETSFVRKISRNEYETVFNHVWGYQIDNYGNVILYDLNSYPNKSNSAHRRLSWEKFKIWIRGL